MAGTRHFYLGGDIGSTKTHVLIVDQDGRAAGFGESGAGNHETVGYQGLTASLSSAYKEACISAGIQTQQIMSMGLGVSGYDWPSDRQPILDAVYQAGLLSSIALANDAVLGLLAGSREGWGVAIVSGTGCNCRGWDRGRRREGRVTGLGTLMGEGAGGSELVARAIQSVAQQWTLRGPVTALSEAFIEMASAKNIEDLLEKIASDSVEIDASAAPIIFRAAENGDRVALSLIEWAGRELGELVNAVIRQLEFGLLEFDVVMVGSMFRGGPLLIDPMRNTIHQTAPGARLVPLTVPPVIGGVLLALEQTGTIPDPGFRERLVDTFPSVYNLHKVRLP